MSKDHEIFSAAQAAVQQQLGAVGRKVGITIADGVVTLMGYVTTAAQKASAERAVAAVPGVRAIAEGLHVIGEPVRPLSDTTIAHAIVRALDTIPGRPSVTVRVEDGWVTLGGQVPTDAAYEAVEQVLECVPGVRGISSEVEIATQPMPA
ncbi:MAG TPA: BON domain-containing protein [Gemmatimonadaceae bacterium]|nr:BON domain-containing protein [Gemmatimonadaceae bacterium]